MTLLTFSWIDYSFFAFMFMISLAIGIYYGCFGNKQSTTKDYLYAGKNMKILPVALSMVASTLSGISLLGIPGDIYMYGTQFWMIALAAAVMAIINNYIYLPVFYNLQLDSTYQYLQLRFDNNVSKFASFLFTVSTFLYLPVVIFAPALAFNQVTGIKVSYIAPIMAIICIFYTTIGGLKTVVWTDTLQFTVTLLTLGFVLVMGTISVGGLGTIWEKAEAGQRIEFFNMDPDPTLRATFWSVTLGQTGLWMSYICIHPAGVQRFLATSSLANAKKTLIIFVIITLITKSINCFSGLIMYAKYFDCDPITSGQVKKHDQLLAYYVMDVARNIPGLSGLFVAGIFSTALSTLSTYLNSLSGTFCTDFVFPLMSKEISEKKASTILKAATVTIGCASLALSFVVNKLGSIVEMWISLNGVTAGPLIGLFTLGMAFPMANSKGALYGSVGSLLFMSWVIIKNRLYINEGVIKFTPKPLYTYGCNITSGQNLTLPAIVSHNISSTILPSVSCPVEQPHWLFRITFNYYSLLGAVVTIVIGLGISWMTRKDVDVVKSDLISPYLHRFLKNSTKAMQYTSVEKNLNNKNVNDEPCDEP